MRRGQGVPKKEAGRRWVLAVIIVSLVWWLISGLAFHVGSASGGFARSLTGLLFNVALSVFLFRGANWARLLIGILSLAGLPALFFGLWDLLVGAVEAGAYFLTAGLANTFIAAVLLFVPAVRAYCAQQNPEATG